MSKLPPPIQKIIAQLRKLPGVGAKTAERYAFRLIEWNTESLELFSQSITDLSKEIGHCPTCHCLKGEGICDFCDTSKRESQSLCIVSYAKDIYPIEETRVFKGLYHVLEGVFSPLEGLNVEKIDVEKIKARIKSHDIKDVILALDSTLEGDATALFLKEEMKSWGLSISRLAFGIPLGSALDYVDPGTLTRALLGRLQF
jgi:recombination protein RecR